MWNEIIYIAIGMAIGAMIVLERVQACEQRTKDEIDADVRKELEFYKNSCQALQEDVAYLRKKLAALRN